MIQDQLISLSSDEFRIMCAPALGGRVVSIEHRGFELLRVPPTLDELYADPWYWSGFFMAPWCNRIVDGRFVFDGTNYAVPVNFDDGSAIHGQVHRRPWTLKEHDPAMGVIVVTTRVVDEFPWPYEVTMTLRLRDPTFEIDLSLKNLGDSAMPAGLGWHPWFSAEHRLVVEVVSSGCADNPGDDLTSISTPEMRAGWFDSSSPHTWGRHELYSGVHLGGVRLSWPDCGAAVSLRTDESAPYVLVYAHEPTRSVAVEPQTHALDGYRRLAAGEVGGLAVLEPRGVLATTVVVAAESGAA